MSYATPDPITADKTGKGIASMKQGLTFDPTQINPTMSEETIPSVICGILPETTNNQIAACNATQTSKGMSLQVTQTGRNAIIGQKYYTTTKTNDVVLTTSTEARTFVTGILISGQSNVTADNVQIYVLADVLSEYYGKYPQIVISGVYLAHIPKLSLTVHSFQIYIPFSSPIELNPGSNVTFTNAFTVGASTTSVVVFGYAE